MKSVSAVVVRLPPPISVNRIWRSFLRNGKLTTLKSEAYRKWEKAAKDMLVGQQLGCVSGYYGLTIKLPRRNRIDYCNAAKCINDMAQSMGIVENDRFCRRLVIEPGVEDVAVCMFIQTKGVGEDVSGDVYSSQGTALLQDSGV